MSDYIDLGPDDVLQEGDQCKSIDSTGAFWVTCVSGFGRKVFLFSRHIFRRPRSIAIRVAATALLTELTRAGYISNNEDAIYLAQRKLAEALGMNEPAEEVWGSTEERGKDE